MNILWSKGPIRDEYSTLPTEMVVPAYYIIDRLKKVENILWIRNTSGFSQSDLDIASQHLHLLMKPVILITSDGDRPVPSSYDKKTIDLLLNSENILYWYTQNYDRSIIHTKLRPFPIGFDLHTNAWLINNSISQKIDFMKSRIENRICNKVFFDCYLSVTHPERRELFFLLKHNTYIEFLRERVAFQDITNMYKKYQFVISVRGAGLDCHRTWELFLAGCIVITRTSSLDDMFIKNKLPVVILNDWSELNSSNIKSKLRYWYKTYIEYTSLEHLYHKLTFDYWI